MNKRDGPQHVERWIRKRTRKGETRYSLDFTLEDGRRVREPAGATLTDARNLRAKREAEILAGTFETKRDRKAREKREREAAADAVGPTFTDFVDRFEREYCTQRKSDYYPMMLKAIVGYFGNRPLKSIVPADLDGYRAHCLNVDRVSKSTTRKRLTVLHTMFRHAVRWGVLDVNPAADLAKPGEPEHKTRYLSREEWDRLHAHAEPWLRPILTVAVLTGARLKEVAGLDWSNVDRQAGVLFVSEDNKTGKPRGVPISAGVAGVLDAIPGSRFKRSGPVFVDPEGEPYTSQRQRNRISQRTKAAASAAELERVSFHTLRHTAGSWLAQAGCSEVQIAKLLGHATTATTKRYMHLSPEHLRGAVDRLSAVLDRHIFDTSAESASSPAPAAPAILNPVNSLGG